MTQKPKPKPKPFRCNGIEIKGPFDLNFDLRIAKDRYFWIKITDQDCVGQCTPDQTIGDLISTYKQKDNTTRLDIVQTIFNAISNQYHRIINQYGRGPCY